MSREIKDFAQGALRDDFDKLLYQGADGVTRFALLQTLRDRLNLDRLIGDARELARYALAIATGKPDLTVNAADPTAAPGRSGLFWFNSSAAKLFVSVGTASVSDWLVVAGGSGGGGGSTDPYWSSVTLLLSMEGVNNGTGFIDLSNAQNSVGVNGNAKISTANRAAGALSVDGSGDFLTVPNAVAIDLTQGDFTIECSVRQYQDVDAKEVLAKAGSNSSAPYRLVRQGNFWMFFGYISSFWDVQFTFGLPNFGSEVHLAVTKQGNQYRGFCQGVLGGGQTSSGTLLVNSEPLRIGALNPNFPTYDFNGEVSWVRITKGIARYTTSFTPPSRPYPTS